MFVVKLDENQFNLRTEEEIYWFYSNDEIKFLWKSVSSGNDLKHLQLEMSFYNRDHGNKSQQ